MVSGHRARHRSIILLPLSWRVNKALILISYGICTWRWRLRRQLETETLPRINLRDEQQLLALLGYFKLIEATDNLTHANTDDWTRFPCSWEALFIFVFTR